MKGLVFNIQRYSIHDGEGIRTLVFLKGCPMHCPWCFNPESIGYEIEYGVINPKCIHCRKCSESTIECPSGAWVQFGKYMSSEEVIQEVMKDSVFYNTSGGGVTLSGGEVLNQAAFSIDILKKLKELGIHTAIETSGMGKKDDLKEMAEYLDLILFDLKIMDETISMEQLGADINIILENIRMLVQMQRKVIPRVPLIPGFTMDDKNINKIIQIVKKLRLTEIHLLPFHQYGSNKYDFINKSYSLKTLKPSSETEIQNIKTTMEKAGFKVIIGGL